MATALDQQFKIEKKGIIEHRIPILHESGMQQHYFVSYVPVPIDDKDSAKVEQWIERMTFIIEDLTWLLQQSHTQFWCEISYNKDFRSLFDSYLRYAPRLQLSIPLPNYSFIPDGKTMEEKVSRLMFMCILRLSTHNESSEHFFTPQGFGEVIYTHYIFDIPRIFDICSLYAVNNQELLSKMIANIFKQQPKYFADLSGAIHSMQDVIVEMTKSFNTQTGLRKLQSNKKVSSISELVDLLYYLLDISSTLNRFFSVYPSARKIFFEENFHLTLLELFETFLRVYQRTNESKEFVDDTEVFEEVKHETIKLIDDFIKHCCVEPLNSNQDKNPLVESLLKIFSSFMTEKRCLATYQDYSNLLDLLEFVQNITKIFDEKEMKYYRDGIHQAIELYGTPSAKHRFNSSVKNISASNISQVKKSSNPNVETIRDMFPHLDENYIEICLKHYNNDTNRLVDALFENTVPENLFIEATKPVQSEQTKATTTESRTTFSSSEQRATIYGDNQFDVFNEENFALGLIHRGKKERDDLTELDDKSHVTELRELYRNFSLVESLTDGEYDDEYDDTYDDGVVNVQDQDETIDKDLPKNENRTTGVEPRRFRQMVDDDDDEENDEENSTNTRRNQFIENPEVVRERLAQQRAAVQQRRQPNRPQPSERDVVGNVRGRGQSSTVVHNRRLKDSHKASQANHNRRYRAAQKANRGLLS